MRGTEIAQLELSGFLHLRYGPEWKYPVHSLAAVVQRCIGVT
jgi:hypothetical protein